MNRKITEKMYKADGRTAEELEARMGERAKAYTPENEDEAAFIASLDLLTSKPVIYAANVSEADLADDGISNLQVAQVRAFAKQEGSEVFVICAKLEEELSELDDEDKQAFLEELGL